MATTDLNRFLEPSELYEQELKTTRFSKSEEKFNELLALSGVNVAENQATVTEYYAKMAELHKAEKALRKVKAHRGWAIFGIVMAFIGVAAFVTLTVLWAVHLDWYACLWAGLALLCLLGALLLIRLIKRSLNGAVAEKQAIRDQLAAEAEAIRQKALIQTAPLKNLLTYSAQIDVLNRLVSVMHFEEHQSEEAFAYMDEHYGLAGADDSEDSSIVGLLAGDISKNPFVMLAQKNMWMGSKTYEGSITISWDTKSKDSQGNTVTEHHTQTLTATVSAPCPYYNLSFGLIYGNEAAPDLSFSRGPSGLSKTWSNGQLARKIKERNRYLQKKAEEAVKRGETYTAVGDDDFEALFGGENRNNEVEYRLLFTPLAQKSMVSLIKSREPYGDDFYFEKRKKLNFVSAEHLVYGRNVVRSSDMVDMISVEELKNYFVGNTAELFTSLYFVFAPIFAIPLYTQFEGDYGEDKNKDYPCHISPFEHERIVNQLPSEEFAHPNTATDVILKTRLAQKMDHCDILEVVAHSFSATTKTSYVSVWGGDGRAHNVPVNWIQYGELTRTGNLAVQKEGPSTDLRGTLQNAGLSDSYLQYAGGLLALKPKHNVTFQDLDDFYAKITPPDLK
jgi:hypothetical protein